MDQKLIEKAKTELREDENRKSQSLVQFREWIAKHPFLSKVENSDSHLIKFLRVRKYNMDEVFQLFERFYLIRKRYPQFFDLEEKDHGRIQEVLKTGYCVPMRERNSEGQKIVLVRPRMWDPEVFSYRDVMRLMCYVTSSVLVEEETQISGIVMIFDNLGLKMKHVVSPTDAKASIEYLKRCSVIRMKAFHLVNLPPVAHIFLEIIKSTSSEKILQRLNILKDIDDLKNHVDINLLPKEYGGKVPIQEMLDEFIEFQKNNRDSLYEAFQSEIDWNLVSKDKIWPEGEETVGSFRKLEID